MRSSTLTSRRILPAQSARVDYPHAGSATASGQSGGSADALRAVDAAVAGPDERPGATGVSDLTEETGMAIIRAIVAGERDPSQLAILRDGRYKHSETAFVEYLTGHWRDEHLDTLASALQLYEATEGQLDLTRINGISVGAAQVILTEVEPDCRRSPPSSTSRPGCGWSRARPCRAASRYGTRSRPTPGPPASPRSCAWRPCRCNALGADFRRTARACG